MKTRRETESNFVYLMYPPPSPKAFSLVSLSRVGIMAGNDPGKREGDERGEGEYSHMLHYNVVVQILDHSLEPVIDRTSPACNRLTTHFPHIIRPAERF